MLKSTHFFGLLKYQNQPKVVNEARKLCWLQGHIWAIRKIWAQIYPTTAKYKLKLQAKGKKKHKNLGLFKNAVSQLEAFLLCVQ